MPTIEEWTKSCRRYDESQDVICPSDRWRTTVVSNFRELYQNSVNWV